MKKTTQELSGYELSRQWFDFSFENPEKIKPVHAAIYFFAMEHCNRLGWKKKFGFPSQMAMDAVGIKNWRTYIKAFNDLVDWGFFDLIEKSKNQYSSNIIAIVKNTEAHTKALDKALQKHLQKHGTKQSSSNYKSTDSIYKQVTIEPFNKGTNKQCFSDSPDFEDSSLQEEGTSTLSVNSVIVPDNLLDIDGIIEAYKFYMDYLVDSCGMYTTPHKTKMDLEMLIELREKGNDPIKVIRQTIHKNNKAFFPLMEGWDKEKGSAGAEQFDEFLKTQGAVV